MSGRSEMLKVKICGITRLDDALAAAEYGADALGFVFYKKSPRYIDPLDAADIIKKLPPFITTTGLFVNEEEDKVRAVVRTAGLDVIQFHGDETPEFVSRFRERVIRAVRVKDEESLRSISGYDVNAFLFDAYSPDLYGGTGKKFDWEVIRETGMMGRFILAGGLDPENVGIAVNLVNPYGVDVSSGVEASPGVKDHRKIKAFIRKARGTV